MALTKLNSQMLEIPVSVTTLSATNLTSSTFETDTIDSTSINSSTISTNELLVTNIATTNLNFSNDGSSIVYNSARWFGDLTVTGSITALSGFNVIISNTTSTSALSVVNDGVGPALYVKQGANTNGVAKFIGSDNTEILRINNTVPSAGLPAVRIINTNTANTFVVGNSANPNSTALVVTSAGRVGIGVSTPTSTLQVSGTIIANNLQGDLTGTLVGNLTSTNSRIATLSTVNILNTNLTSTVITTDTLNANDINIGTLILGDTTTTSFLDIAPLQIIGSSFKSLFNQIQNTATSVSASTDLALYNNTGNYVDIGIASSNYDGSKYGPTFTVTRANDGYIYNSAGGNMLIGTTQSNGNVVVFAGGSLSGAAIAGGDEIAYFTPSGNVGIGTSIPNQTLTVIGNISATNSINTNTITVTSVNIQTGGNITSANQRLTFVGSVSTTGGIAASGLQIRDSIYSTNTTMGSAKLDGRGALVNTTAITNNSRVFLTTQIPSGTVGSLYVAERASTVSFKVSSTQVGDTSIFAWMIVEPTI